MPILLASGNRLNDRPPKDAPVGGTSQPGSTQLLKGVGGCFSAWGPGASEELLAWRQAKPQRIAKCSRESSYRLAYGLW